MAIIAHRKNLKMYLNAHSHRKALKKDEIVCRNAFHFLNADTIRELDYPVSVGIHPWHSSECVENSESILSELLHLPNVLALGEAGLDRVNGPLMQIQLDCWEMQFQLAHRLKMPIIVHCVRAWQDIFPFCKRSEVPILLHDFRGNEQILQQFLPLEMVYFSFGKSLIKTKNTALIFKKIPANRLLLETDNSALQIEDIFKKAASLRNQGLPELCEQMKKNGHLFFGEKSLAFF